jgi:hypothetical protein
MYRCISAFEDVGNLFRRPRIGSASGKPCAFGPARSFPPIIEAGRKSLYLLSSVQEAATGTTQISKNIGGVTKAANDTGVAANQMLGAAADLAKQSDVLRNEVGKFLANVRAA